MPSYRILIQPSANRVYTRHAPELARSELAVLSEFALDGALHDLRVIEMAGAPFVAFETDAALAPEALTLLATASSTYVVFEDHDGLLGPLPAKPLSVYPDDLLTTLKYAGKTNEHFTALLVNLALAVSTRGFAALQAGEHVRLLDPLCGRGTTLNQALMYGLDAAGIDTDTKDLEIYIGFARQYLQDHRIKHRSESLRVKKGKHHTVIINHRTGHEPSEQTLDVINDDTVNALVHLGSSKVDLVVGDLPYGVQHNAKNDEWGHSRNPATLLETALPVWRSVLRGGGALCLAYNRKILAPEVMDALVREARFLPVDLPENVSFEHRVDRSIQRDVLLAVKPS